MALTQAQRRALSRRTTASSRARLRQRLQGPTALRLGPAAPQAPRAFTAPGQKSTMPVTAPGPAPGANAARPASQFVPDASYLAQAAQAQFQRQTQLDQIKAEHDAAVNTFGEGQRRLMEGVPEQRQQVNQNAAKQGLFYSGQLGKRLGDLETQIARQRADAQSQFDVEDRARDAARNAILAGEPIETAALKAQAVERQIGRDTDAAQANALAPTPVPARKPAPKPKRRPRPKHRRHNR